MNINDYTFNSTKIRARIHVMCILDTHYTGILS